MQKTECFSGYGLNWNKCLYYQIIHIWSEVSETRTDSHMAFQFYFGLVFVVFLDEDCILRGVLNATENVHLQALQRTENYGRYLCISKCQENASETTWNEWSGKLDIFQFVQWIFSILYWLTSVTKAINNYFMTVSAKKIKIENSPL